MSRPISGVLSSRPSLPQRSSSLTKQAVISPDYPHQRINTDIKGTDIDTCAFGPRHNIDLPPRHIWYRHWRLPTRQYNHQADKLFWTYHNRRYRYHGWHRCRSRCHRGPARWPKDLGLWHHPCSHVLAFALTHHFTAVVMLK